MRNAKSNPSFLFLLMIIVSIFFLGFFSFPELRENPIERVNNNESTFDTIDEEMITKSAEKAIRCQFYENLGQVGNPDVKFYGNIPGGMIGFAESKILFWLEGADSIVTLLFEGAQHVVPIGVSENSHQTNYFLGTRGTYTNIPSFSSVVYENLWLGIDLIYKATANGAKYEFRVAPGTDPTNIRIRCEGSDSLMTGKTSVRIENGNGMLVDDGLKVTQETTDIEGEFISYGDSVFGFGFGDYDTSKTLVIDPLLYSTFVGGTNTDRAYSITIDSMGNAYVTGETWSSDFPTVNAYDSEYSFSDTFVFKLNSTGNGLLYSTFVGGGDNDYGHSIITDGSGNAFVSGYTNSDDFPTVNAFDSTLNGSDDAFVLKLNSTGNGLNYSTYVGGTAGDFGYSIAIDALGNAYVTGYTESSDFPTVNAYDSKFNGTIDSFVFKLNSTGNGLNYSTYLGGTENDFGASLAVDTSGNAYLTGWTTSSDFPTVNAYDDTLVGTPECFVLKLNSTGNGLNYSTFVGGMGMEYARYIAIDALGNAYVTGEATSDFPTVNAYDDSYNAGPWDCFVFKLNSTGNGLNYSTYVGGTGRDYGVSIAINASGDVYITGNTESSDFPVEKAYDSSLNGTRDSFLFKLNSTGNGLFYSTYVGGDGEDWGYSVSVNTSGNAFVAGDTKSSDFPTVNAYDDSFNGTNDCFVFNFVEDTTSPDLDSPAPILYEQGSIGNNITWTAGDQSPYQYRVDGNGSTVDWTAWSNGSLVIDVDGLIPGLYNHTITIVDAWGNEAKDTVFVTVLSPAEPIWIEEPRNRTISEGEPFFYNLNATDISGLDSWWINDTTQFQIDVTGIITNKTTLGSGYYGLEVYVNDTLGNTLTGTFFVRVGIVDHDPIIIVSDADFASQAASEGWEGDGSEGNPYIIEWYVFDSNLTCMFINNTNACFIVRYCVFNSSIEYTMTGLLDEHPDIMDCGIWIEKSNYGKIINCTIRDQDIIGIDIRNCTCYIINCTFINNTVGGYFRLSTGCALVNSTFEGCNFGIADWGEWSLSYRNHIIQNNTVNGKPMGYFFDVNDTIIDGSQYGQIMLAGCTNVTIQGGFFKDTSYPISLGFCTNCTISDAVIQDNAHFGMYAAYCTNCEFINNSIDNIGIEPWPWYWNYSCGITVVHCSYCNFTENKLTNIKFVGFSAQYSDHCILTDNIADNNSLDGFDIGSSSYITLRNNIARYNGGTGFGITYTGHCVLESNTAFDNSFRGFFLGLDSDYCILFNNTANNNSQSGVYLYESNNCTLISNKIHNNTAWGVVFNSIIICNLTMNTIYYNHDGVFFKDSANGTLTHNVIYSNSQVGIGLGAENFTLINNTIYGNGNDGVKLGVNNCDMINNSIYDNIELGLCIWFCQNLMFSNNSVYNNLREGILVENCSECSFINNEIYNNGACGILVDENSSSITVYGNLIGWNPGGDAQDDGWNNNWDDGLSIGNAWGDYNGTAGIYTIPGSTGSIDNYPSQADTTIPTINHPINLWIEEGSTGQSLTWSPSDVHPFWYQLYREGSRIVNTGWDGSGIQVSLDGLAGGEYNFTIVVFDTCYNWVLDTVIVFVGSTEHAPIIITSDAYFASNATAEGWDGDGTEGNPYIIEGLEIDYNGTCIEIRDVDAYFIIQYCLIASTGIDTGRGIYGIDFGILIDNSDHGTIFRCKIRNQDDYGILVQESVCTIANCTFTGNRVGLFLASTSLCTIANNTFENCGILISDSLIDADHWNHDIDNNQVNGKPLAYYWNENDLDIDCSQFGQVILGSCTNVTIRDGTFTNVSIGIILGCCTNCTIRNNTINSCSIQGIYVRGCVGCILNDNLLDSNGLRGIWIHGSNYCHIYDNTISNSGYWHSAGVTIQGSSYCNFTHNTVFGLVQSGLYLPYGGLHTVTDNIIHNNRWGIRIDESVNNLIQNNTIYDNTDIGVWLEPDSDNCRVINNTIRGSDYGLSLSDSHNLMISGNIIRDNSNHGMLVDSERNCTIAENEIYRNQDGIRLLYVTNTTIIRNFIYDNELDGIFVWDCPDEINIRNNTIYNNEKNGIHVLGSRFTFIQDVILYGNTLNGIFMNNSRSCTLDPSKIYSNSMSGVLLNNVTTTSISDNEIYGNEAYGVFIDAESSANSVENNIIGWNGAGNAHDDGSSNTWLFNAWGDYTGALGTYAIPGSAGSVDTYPEKADTVAPTIDSPEDIQYELGSTGHTITWTPSDDHPSLYWVYIEYGDTIESGDWIADTISISIDGLNVGEYTYNIIVYDTCNNSISDEVTVTVVDTTPPVIVDISHDPISPTTVEDVTVFASVIDIAGIAEVILSYSSNDGITWTNRTMISVSGDQYSGTIPEHSPGTTVTYKIFARDINDNWHESGDNDYQVALTAETNPPNFSDLTASPSLVYSGQAITITVTVTDESDLVEVTLSYSTDNQATWSNISMSSGSGNEWTAVIPGQNQGATVHYKVYARDLYGNWGVSGTGALDVRAPTEIDPMLLIVIGAGGVGLVAVLAIVMLRKKPKRPKPEEPVTFAAEAELEALREVPPPAVIAKPEPEVVEKTVKAFRGCEIIGGKFEYKAKVKNDTDFVIHNVTVTILGYPEDCMEIAGPTMKKVTRIEPSGFRSPQFTFTPTKDCVEGQISATVSYLDHQNKTRMLEVEPYTIRSVCDLLTPLEASLEEFDLLLSDMEVATEERTFDWNAEVLFEKTKTMFSAKNFYIIEAKDEKIDGEFRGTIRGLAEGKYTGKRVALRLIISGPADGTQANVEVEGLGEDIAMLPTTIDEISKGIDSWTCMNCGGALDSNEVTKIKSGENVECRYCRHIMTIDLYRR